MRRPLPFVAPTRSPQQTALTLANKLQIIVLASPKDARAIEAVCDHVLHELGHRQQSA